MTQPAIRVEGLSKRFELGVQQASYRTLRDSLAATALAPARALKRMLGPRREAPDRSMWALRDVTFDVLPGTVLGVVGRNGAGKSTLLKILSRITEPTTGFAEIRGRVGSLLEVGTGFHPELSGRENIYLNGAILGMPRADIIRKFDQIVQFAEVERFIDTAVKHYSSGMYLRLAFAVAAHLEPEILLVDEVLAVGDQAFQQKCLGKMGEVAGEGRTVLFVSHNLAAVRALCTEALLLRDGQISLRGSPTEVINQYLLRDEISGKDLSASTQREGDGSVRFTAAKILDHTGQVTETVLSGEEMTVELQYTARDAIGDSGAFVFHVHIRNAFGDRLFTCSTRYAARAPHMFPATGHLRCKLPRLPLAAGQYGIDIVCKNKEKVADHVWGALTLEVNEGDFWGNGKVPRPSSGPLLVDHEFEVAT